MLYSIPNPFIMREITKRYKYFFGYAIEYV